MSSFPPRDLAEELTAMTVERGCTPGCAGIMFTTEFGRVPKKHLIEREFSIGRQPRQKPCGRLGLGLAAQGIRAGRPPARM